MGNTEQNDDEFIEFSINLSRLERLPSHKHDQEIFSGLKEAGFDLNRHIRVRDQGYYRIFSQYKRESPVLKPKKESV